VRFLIDTNIAIHARDGTDQVVDQLARHSGRVLLSTLSLAELQRGALSDDPARELRRLRLDAVLGAVLIVDFDSAAARAYGDILAAIGWVRGRDYDRMIAGHAISLGATLVTNNARDFRDIPGLSVEDWLSGR
jgi:tRNA(fMet)-specific endonuclease VapC